MDKDEKGDAKEVCPNQLQQKHVTETPEAVPGKFNYGGVLQRDGDGTSEGKH